MASKKRKKKIRVFITLLFLVFLAVYGGVKSGEYLANKLSKPVPEKNSNAFENIKVEGEKGERMDITEDEMVAVTSVVTEFITAEHLKKNDRLAYLTDPDYYSTLLKKIKNMSSGEAVIQDINYIVISNKKVEVEVVSLKNSKKITENLTIEKQDSTWKITNISK